MALDKFDVYVGISNQKIVMYSDLNEICQYFAVQQYNVETISVLSIMFSLY